MMMAFRLALLALAALAVAGFASASGPLSTNSPSDKEVHSDFDITVYVALPPQAPVYVQVSSDDYGTLVPLLREFVLPAGSVFPAVVPIAAVGVGSAKIVFNVTSDDKFFAVMGLDKVKVQVVHSLPLSVCIAVIGWLYFVAWSLSFYPQVYLNWKRKSVVGLNFDFLALNLTGFLLYTFFNAGLFWSPTVKDEYKRRHPDGVNPVQANDVFFPIHASVLTIVSIVQCYMYERGGQRVSLVARALVCTAWLFAFVGLFPTIFGPWNWLDYLYAFSYVKLGITLIKYIPQAVMNYRRKSTQGWSIGNILLDFTGGALSILQMFMLAYNNDDWSSIFGDPTKFGLGLFSILFDILFMVQHYVLYRDADAGDKTAGSYEALYEADYEGKGEQKRLLSSA